MMRTITESSNRPGVHDEMQFYRKVCWLEQDQISAMMTAKGTFKLGFAFYRIEDGTCLKQTNRERYTLNGFQLMTMFNKLVLSH